MEQQKFSAHLRNHHEDNSIRWFRSDHFQVLNGVALVIHGLNLRPDKMGSIISNLTGSGIDVLNLSLRGHGENFSPSVKFNDTRARLEAFKKVSYRLWIDETYRAYLVAKNRSDRKYVPLFLIGFSFGALIGTDLFASASEINFDRMVFFAPALKMHYRNHSLRLLAPFTNLTIPSFTLLSYQSNAGTPIAGYNALFDSYHHLQRRMSLKINVPTVIFIDKKDEIVSFNRLKKMVGNQKLDRWKFYIVHKEKTGEPGRMHHLIIDEPSTGKSIWEEMMGVMNDHLLKN